MCIRDRMFDAEGYEVVAINDLTSPKMPAHLLKYDTAQGSFCGKIGEAKHTVESVSYTHLDVYKRQEQCALHSMGQRPCTQLYI